MRPLNRKKESRLNEFVQDVWSRAKSAGNLEQVQETQVFHLTPREAKRCRYVMTNMDQRLAECTVHTDGFTHGVRMHPPHLYDMKKGIVYYRENAQAEWKQWFPNAQENANRNGA